MVLSGGDRRVLAIAAGGTYVIYVVLTCIFYFVGLAYENVSEVTRFILFMGAHRLCHVTACPARFRRARADRRRRYVAADNQVPFSA